MEGKTLLIIGNGFDLKCGLKSSYPDFFEWLRKDTSRVDNLWTRHFLNNCPKGQNWTNVEEALLKTFIIEKHKRTTPVQSWTDDAYNSARTAYPYAPSTPITLEGEYIRNNSHGVVKIHEFQNHYGLHWFLSQLKSFEFRFGEYLRGEVERLTDYNDRADKVLNMLTDGEDVDIVSFNYTKPFRSRQVKHFINVHGTYEDNNIIFGVDATEDLPSDYHIFTKTHRKMLQDNYVSALPLQVGTIKFFGHSLSKADYSYFQSIFDGYNLYGKLLTGERSGVRPVVLQFYFSTYGGKSEAEIKREESDKVYKLITAYATETLGDNGKGKNLLHKLLLEGRIQIKLLESISWN